YERIAATPLFHEGLRRLERGMQSHRVALMCAEADPIMCHRTILVCRTLRGTGVEIAHILADGRLEPQADAEARLVSLTRAGQAGLFDSSDPVERAYALQAERIAYRPGDRGDGHLVRATEECDSPPRPTPRSRCRVARRSCVGPVRMPPRSAVWTRPFHGWNDPCNTKCVVTRR
ncbi:MAG TPA: DUF488 family protein, partial [Alphaproteobacteria bacterium]|nr:DUF488 family protein [Alphaproteobacteria bacterium]